MIQITQGTTTYGQFDVPKLIPSHPRRVKRRAAWVGALLGLSAAFSGVVLPVSIGGLRPWHLLLLAAILIAISSSLSEGLIRKARLLPVDLGVGLYVGVCIVAELINARELRFAPDILNVISPLFYYMGYIAARISVRSYDQAVYFLRQFVWPILIATPLALGQSLGNPGITQLVLAVAPGAGATRRLENDGLTRATGLVGHWTGFGAYAVCVVAAAVALLIISKHLGLRRPRLALVTLLAAAMCVISTLTLSVAVAALAIVLCCWRSAGLGRQLLIAAGVLSATASVVFGSLIQARVDQQFTDRVSRISWLPDWVPDTLNYRARIWTEQTIPMVQDRPLTGWGTNLYEGVYLGLEGQRVYPTQLLWHSPESQWLGSAMTFGLFGLCAQVVLLLAIAHLLISAHRERDSMLIARPILMLFVMSILVATTVPVFTNRGFPMAFWPLLGVLTGIYLSGSRSARNSAD